MSQADSRQTGDRRLSTRVPFGATVSICECEEAIPPREEFRTVQASDLSHSGMSFTTDTWPRSDSIAVLMGEREHPVYVLARVVRCIERSAQREAGRFDVHCEFDQWLLEGTPRSVKGRGRAGR